MSEGQLGDVEATPQPGDPSGLDDAAVEQVLRRRQRGMVLTAVGVLAAYAALLVVLSLVHSAPPTRYAWVLLGVVVVLVAAFLWPLRSSAAREGAADRARTQVRIDAALRAHVSIGADDRDEVTAAAEARRSLGTAAWLGYPLLALFLAFLLFNSALPGLAASLGTLVAVVLCGLALVRSRRRAAEGRRWLAEPLPPRR